MKVANNLETVRPITLHRLSERWKLVDVSLADTLISLLCQDYNKSYNVKLITLPLSWINGQPNEPLRDFCGQPNVADFEVNNSPFWTSSHVPL